MTVVEGHYKLATVIYVRVRI